MLHTIAQRNSTVDNTSMNVGRRNGLYGKFEAKNDVVYL